MASEVACWGWGGSFSAAFLPYFARIALAEHPRPRSRQPHWEDKKKKKKAGSRNSVQLPSGALPLLFFLFFFFTERKKENSCRGLFSGGSLCWFSVEKAGGSALEPADVYRSRRRPLPPDDCGGCGTGFLPGGGGTGGGGRCRSRQPLTELQREAGWRLCERGML